MRQCIDGTLWERLAWYRARLAMMSVAEIRHRLREAATKQASRYKQGWQDFGQVDRLASLPGVAARVRTCRPSLTALIANEANNVLAGHFHLLGAHWPVPAVMPPPPDFWHVDPKDGELFPQRDAYCFDCPFRHGVNTREIKRIWELNRLQFMVPLAAGAVIADDQRSVELVFQLIGSWMEGNPPFRGLNWSSGIELALRVISVALSLSIIGIERLDEETRIAALQFFFAHVDWIKRFPSLYSSANNHRIAELTGLVIGTTMAPEIPGATRIREESWRELLVEIDRQIHPDGVGAEQSLGYTAFAIELFLLAAATYGCENDLPGATVARLSAWADHALWLMDIDAKVPALGDFDDCRAIATTQAPEPRYVASIVSVVASCIDRHDLAPPAKDPSIRDVILGSAGISQTHRVGLRSFPIGGYSVIRETGEVPVVLTFDHAPVGYLSIAAHGHADALAVWLSVGNQPIFVDAGTYLYHSGKALRDKFRETEVHNTLTLDGRSSSRPSGPFNWATKANARLIALASGPTTRAVAEHDGYVSRYGVRHRRAIEFDGTSRFTITDELLGPLEDRKVTVSFLLDPTCQARLDSDGNVLISGHGRSIARLISAGPLKPRIVRGEEKSGRGFVSPSFGVRVPADQILFEGVLKKPSSIMIDLL
jgi:Heparinase II/III-like protein/Heparinase II/III N-terminus